MKVLVTGGTGVVGAGAIPELVDGGHTVRLLSRGALHDALDYAHGVEPFPADISQPGALRQAAEGCQVVIHIAGIVEERPPDVTFQKVNVEGTRQLVKAAQDAGVTRFIFLSSLGADTGQSDYHLSKRAAEAIVRQFAGEWVILRPGNVYGPGDDVISAMLKMVRSLPAVPVIEGGTHRFQPLWCGDLGRALRQALTDPRVVGQTLELAGTELTDTANLIERLKEITARNPATISVGRTVASLGVKIAETGAVQNVLAKTGLSMPLNSAKLQMLLEENVIRSGRSNALVELFNIQPTSLDQGLRMLADELPELLPSDGVGLMERKRFWADLPFTGSPGELMRLFRAYFNDVMPIEFTVEPGAPTELEEGATLTAAVPARGNIQVRVEEVTDSRITLATVEGHFLAGLVSFTAESVAAGTRFAVEIFARPSNIFDWLAMRTVGQPLQNQNWTSVVERLGEMAAGQSPEVMTESVRLEEAEAERVERWIDNLIQRRKRAQSAVA